MSVASLMLGFVAALTIAAVATPVARRVALRRGLLDHPTGWKTHPSPTPYVGGIAVLAGVSVGALVAASARTTLLVLLVAWGLCVVGVADDARNLDVRLRLGLEAAAGVFLWVLNIGWHFAGSDGLNLLVTCIWVIGIMSAFNIIDLMDGLASSVMAICAGGLAVLAWLDDDLTTTAIALAIVGACLGFLPFNLISPARIFLGDGGTMPLGFLVAVLIPLALDGAAHNPTLLASAPLFFWIPLFDAAWRAAKRTGRGVSLMTAGHDSLADSLKSRVVTPARVALVACSAQTLCSGVAVSVVELEGDVEVVAAVVAGASLIVASATSSPRFARRVDALN